ncbi:MAG: hypothetical protein IID61_12925 [SAR324 cluster bacterium]|nr:hypothetical protein [SAR324 cluster bacterium]
MKPPWLAMGVGILLLSWGPAAMGQSTETEELNGAPGTLAVEDDGDSQRSEMAGDESPFDGLSLQWSGYLKPILIFEMKDFGDLGPPPRENFEHLGVRTKIRLDGRLRDQARIHVNYLLDFNEVNQTERTVADDGNLGDVRLIEAYVDLLSENSQWRIGAQQKSWYEFNGLADPTDRFNPRDNSFQSYKLEEIKIPETGVAWSWFYTGSDTLTITYVPVSGVNKFSPTLGGFYSFLGYCNTAPPAANTSNSKYALEITGEAGGFTYLFTHISGLNPRPDFADDNLAAALAADENKNCDNAEPDEIGRLEYKRVESPGLDLTYAISESMLGKFDVVYYDMPASDKDGDLGQRDWYEYLVGAEMHFGGMQVDLNLGQKIVPGAVETDDLNLDDRGQQRTYFQYALLDQPRETTNVVTFKIQSRFGDAEWLEFKFDVLLNSNKNGDIVRYRIRPEFAVYLAPNDALLFRMRPDLDQNREITTRRLWAELELRF